MKLVFFLLLTAHVTLYGQTVYQPHEVQQAAEPSGGMAHLNQFMASNMRMPFPTAVKGISGRVFVKGIVEPDGSMSNIEITRGINPLCDKEAVRLFSIYKAWKPAMLKNEKVRQAVVYPLSFRAEPKANFDSTRSALVDYYDARYYRTSDPKKYVYRSILPVDDAGYVNQDVVYEQLKGSKWKEISRVPFQRRELWYKTKFRAAADSVQAYEISARDKENFSSHSSEVIFDKNGALLFYTEYGSANKASMTKAYDASGMVREMHMLSDSADLQLSWYPHGQIQEMTQTLLSKNHIVSEKRYINSWDPQGNPLVVDGNGYWISQENGPDGAILVEQGRVADGKKVGRWQGKWADSTVHYEETYQAGVLEKGTSDYGGSKLVYDVVQKNPEFKGGLSAFYQFLAQNISYPIEAARQGVAGRVFLSFVVCEDGSLCDYKVISGVGFGLDDEALRVVKKMSGLWQPGELRGKVVRVKYNVPINFQLQ